MMELPEQAFRRDADGVRIRVHAQPGAKQSRIAGAYGETVKIAVATPPVDGKANKALQKLLADWLKVSASRVTLASGMTGREKQFVVSGMSPEEAKDILQKIF